MAIYPKTGDKSTDGAVDGLHLVRPVKHKKLSSFLGGSIKEITMSKSTWERLPEKSKELIRERGIGFKIEKRQGRSLERGEKIRDVVEFHRDFKSYRKIEKELGIPKSTAHYLVKYAKRSKIKKGEKVFYLE